MNILSVIIEALIILAFAIIQAWLWIKCKVWNMRKWLRSKVLTIKYVKEPGVMKTELRFLGIKIGRATYCRIGRWLGHKKDDWRDPDGDIRRF